MRDQDLRAALERHWVASDSDDFAAEQEIYEDDAVLGNPQSRGCIRGRRRIQESRMAQPNKKRFTVRRLQVAVVFGSANLSSPTMGSPHTS